MAAPKIAVHTVALSYQTKAKLHSALALAKVLGLCPGHGLSFALSLCPCPGLWPWPWPKSQLKLRLGAVGLV